MVISFVGRSLSPDLWWLLWSEFLCGDRVWEPIKEMRVAAPEFLLWDSLDGLLCREIEFSGEVSYGGVELLVSHF